MTGTDSAEKKGLLIIAGLSVVGMIAIAIAAIYHGVDAGGATLVGVVAAGLATFGKDIVSAIRGYSMSAQLGKVTDQLAASAPLAGGAPAPQTVQDAADAVAGAASDEADRIGERE